MCSLFFVLYKYIERRLLHTAAIDPNQDSISHILFQLLVGDSASRTWEILPNSSNKISIAYLTPDPQINLREDSLEKYNRLYNLLHTIQHTVARLR